MKKWNRRLILFIIGGFLIFGGLANFANESTRAMGLGFFLTGLEIILANYVYDNIKKNNKNHIIEVILIVLMIVPIALMSVDFTSEQPLFLIPLTIIIGTYLTKRINKYYKLNTLLKVVLYILVIFLIMLGKISISGILNNNDFSDKNIVNNLPNDELFTKKIENSQKTSLEIQEKCANQAKLIFDNYKKEVALTYNYQNHYNNKFNKCYILIRGSTDYDFDNILLDAYENTQIADCKSYSPGNIGKDDILRCDYPNSKEEQYNINKFNEFVKNYMEN